VKITRTLVGYYKTLDDFLVRQARVFATVALQVGFPKLQLALQPCQVVCPKL
jgi:hypothetical protein